MKTIMSAKSPHDSSFSFSRRYFHWKKNGLDNDDDEEQSLNFSTSSSSHFLEEVDEQHDHHLTLTMAQHQCGGEIVREKKSKFKFKSAFMVFTTRVWRLRSSNNLSHGGKRVVGTLFGHRRGHVCFAFQENGKQLVAPVFVIELATPTSVLVREMASGLVRIALECEKRKNNTVKLLEEPLWRTYCNGRKCGYANRRECGEEEWKILKAVEPISMGAGVLPGNGRKGSEDGEIMYMRAKYERVVGSTDSEAFYMMNPDASGGGPELSIYFIRV